MQKGEDDCMWCKCVRRSEIEVGDENGVRVHGSYESHNKRTRCCVLLS